MIVLGKDVLMTSSSKASAVRVVGSSVVGVPDPPQAASAPHDIRTRIGFRIFFLNLPYQRLGAPDL